MKSKISIAICLAIFCVCQAASATGYVLTVNTTNLVSGQQLKISWSAPSGTPSADWIGIYPATGTPSNYLYRISTGGSTTNSVSTELYVPQTYVVEYFQNGGFVGMTPPVYVQVLEANDSYNLSVTPTIIDQDEIVVVSWNVPTNVNILNDRIGYFRVDTNTTSLVQYIILPASYYSGSAWFTMFAPPGLYAFEWFKHGAPNLTNAVTTPILVNVNPAPAQLTIKALSSNEAGLTWQTKTGAVYTVLSSKNFALPAEQWQTITEITGSGQSVLIPVPMTNGNQHFRLLER